MVWFNFANSSMFLFWSDKTAHLLVTSDELNLLNHSRSSNTSGPTRTFS